MARRFATRIGAIRAIDSQKKKNKKKKIITIFITCERSGQITSKLRFAIFGPPKRDSAEKRVQFGNTDTIRENQVIRTNLRIDSRESGHLRGGV